MNSTGAKISRTRRCAVGEVLALAVFGFAALLPAPAPAAAPGSPLAATDTVPLALSLSTAIAFGPRAALGAATGTAGGRDPYAVAVGDFDGDGRPDLAVTNHAGSTVSILLNETEPRAGSASYRLAASQAVGALPYAVVAGDFNGDGKVDLATANSGDDSVSVLLNGTMPGDYGPSFAAVAVPTASFGTIAIVACDIDGDGRLDLATANYFSSSVSVLLNDTVTGASEARFSVAASLPIGDDSGPYALVAGDFNGDGKADLATANSYENTVSILLNGSKPGSDSGLRFAAASNVAVGQGPVALAIGDFNGDRRPDLASANNFDGTVSILINGTAPGAAATRFDLAANLTVGINSGLASVAVVDFNGDGKLDLVTANDGSDTLSVLSNSTAAGTGGTRFSVVATPNVSGNLYAVAVGDFNGDGRPDLAVTSGGRSDGSSISTLTNITPAAQQRPQLHRARWQYGLGTTLSP